MTPSNVPLVPDGSEFIAPARDLAERWGLPCEDTGENHFRLRLGTRGLSLEQTTGNAPGPIRVDFVSGAAAHRRRFGGGRGQAIARAVGLRGGGSPRVIDATAGLGRDAFVLASLGCTVTLVERSPVVAALLEDGLRRACADPEIGEWVRLRMRLVHAAGADFLRQVANGPQEQRPDVVYLDPMYPHREKSALVKKEMRTFQALVGADGDAADLLQPALAAACRRVVVKRPDYAPPLDEHEPSTRITTKKNRFDVYIIHAATA